ncbi:precorrin-6y C5,15-methyltransferase (decarboxylating) subunit CbiE [Minwuia thermotolerans]|uniref:Cobalamin biosynthesis bifunctional protein CbiET n=1 Tax=Minwuia thermotolerans TaxID=2056226 RepID=A0A2M9FWI7_9PROT|nr:precorrin-6y C5,15-methyltransferase (decarboxylating) subunit CbiE [Minwuia thermotolerans]PJK27822.1 cobalamin biosynthesis bifunctional protein CbiET [Minwuia thermotolerans]
MTGPWLSVVGVTEEGAAALPPSSRRLVDDAEVLIGGERHLAMFPEDGRERLTWTRPLKHLAERIGEFRGRRVAVLATGDPLNFGVAAKLLRHVPIEEMVIAPAPSAFSLIAARMGWSLPDVECISLHGRPADRFRAWPAPGLRIIALSGDAETPPQVAKMLAETGYGQSRMTVFGHVGGPKESRSEALAADWGPAIPDLNTMAVECVADPGLAPVPRTPGLADDLFRHDGKMTKREVRAITLAKLAPHRDALLWDVGAGCGSVAIEWMRAAPEARAVALEPDAGRRAMAADNAIALGVPELELIDGRAPAALAGLPRPDAIFVGGGVSDPAVIPACRAALAAGGRIVANAVTLEGQAELQRAYRDHGGELVRIAVERAAPVGTMTGWRPAMPVMQWSAVKR